jgi:hypothetical protein
MPAVPLSATPVASAPPLPPWDIAHQRREVLDMGIVGAGPRLALQELLGVNATGIEYGAASLEIERNHLCSLIKFRHRFTADLQFTLDLRSCMWIERPSAVCWKIASHGAIFALTTS